MNQNLVKFFYKEKIYSLDFNLFKKHAKYHLGQDDDYHYLVSEFEGDLNLTEEIIQSFLDFFQSQTINITTNNVLILNYLSHKYQISKLSNLTKEFIKNNTNDIFKEILSNQNEIEFEVVNFISSNFLDFITDDRLLTLSITRLHHIIKKYTQNIKLKNNEEKEEEGDDNVKEKEEEEKEKKIIDFLFRVIQRKGNEASILFPLFEFSKKGRKLLNLKLQSNLKLFDFNFAVLNMIMRSIDNDEEHQEQEMKFKEKYELLEKQFHRKIQELENKFEDKLNSLEKQFQQKFQEQENKFKENINSLTDQLQQKFQLENSRFEQLNKTIYNVNSSKYFNEKNDYETFNELKCESQLMIILGLLDKNPDNRTIQNISSLLQYLSNEQRRSNYKFNQIKYIQIDTENNKNKL